MTLPTGRPDGAATVTVELTRFRVPAARAGELLAARAGMVAAFATHRPGFLGAELVRLDDETWVDVVRWARPEDLAESRRRGADSPAVAAFFAPIAELLAAESGPATDPGADAPEAVR
ncbi:antibiotic biosynthesis monooxygenase family protein [Isoptericola variabilis]|uniref:antibiotic biosynthesis monooxygenase family protein n=1 Tax=Isoptericola variabilis TaxID=139208 RepID=UPI003D1C9540